MGKSKKTVKQSNQKIIWKKGVRSEYETTQELWEEFGDLVPQCVANAIKSTRPTKKRKGEWR